jgi:hypothetical protein
MLPQCGARAQAVRTGPSTGGIANCRPAVPPIMWAISGSGSRDEMATPGMRESGHLRMQDRTSGVDPNRSFTRSRPGIRAMPPAARSVHPVKGRLTISPLRQRLIDDMAIRRLGPKTQHDYIRRVKSFADSLATLPTRPPRRMSIGISCGWCRSERRYRPSTPLPVPCGSSSRSR